VIRTEWHDRDIWVRRDFTLPENYGAIAKLALRIHHDEDAEIYLNGRVVANLSGWTQGYTEVTLPPGVTGVLHAGRNVMAIHCRQNNGGQYIDAGLLEYVSRKRP